MHSDAKPWQPANRQTPSQHRTSSGCGNSRRTSSGVDPLTPEGPSGTPSVRTFLVESLHPVRRASSLSGIEVHKHDSQPALETAKSVPLHLLAIPDLPSLLRLPIYGSSTVPPVSAAARWRKGKLAMNVNHFMAGLGGRHANTNVQHQQLPTKRKKRKVPACLHVFCTVCCL